MPFFCLATAKVLGFFYNVPRCAPPAGGACPAWHQRTYLWEIKNLSSMLGKADADFRGWHASCVFPSLRSNSGHIGLRLSRRLAPSDVFLARGTPAEVAGLSNGGAGQKGRLAYVFMRRHEAYWLSPIQRVQTRLMKVFTVVCVKFCKKYFRKIQFLSIDRRRACGNVGKLSVLGEAFPRLRGNPRLLRISSEASFPSGLGVSFFWFFFFLSPPPKVFHSDFCFRMPCNRRSIS